jgi:hypothetical protein
VCAGLTHLAFLLHEQWPPYPKWTEVFLRRLPGIGTFARALEQIARASRWPERESAIRSAASLLLATQRDRGLPAPDSATVPFWDRPYPGIAEPVWRTLLATIADPQVTALPPGIGSLEQWTANTDILSRPDRRIALASAYREWLATAAR